MGIAITDVEKSTRCLYILFVAIFFSYVAFGLVNFKYNRHHNNRTFDVIDQVSNYKIYVISMRSRLELMNLTAHLRSFHEFSRSTIIFINGHNGSSYKPTHLLDSGTISNIGYNSIIQTKKVVMGHYITPGAVGCFLSHRDAWNLASLNKYPSIIIEDDMTFIGDLSIFFHYLIPLQRQIHLAYFGNILPKSQARQHRHFNLYFNKFAGANWGTYAYVVSPKGAKLLYDESLPISYQVDSYMIDKCMEKGCISLVPKLDNFVIVDSSPNRTSTVQHYRETPVIIPRIFHFIWVGEEKRSLRRVLNSWSEVNHGWKTQLWNEQDILSLVLSYSKEISLLASKFLDHSGKIIDLRELSDIARYLILAKYGGVYVDTDVLPLRPFELIIGGVSSFIGYESKNQVCNAILGSTKNHPFILDLIQNLPGQASYDTVNLRTGPQYVQKRVDTFVKSHPFQVTIFASHIFYPVHFSKANASLRSIRNDVGRKMFPESYAVHIWEYIFRDAQSKNR